MVLERARVRRRGRVRRDRDSEAAGVRRDCLRVVQIAPEQILYIIPHELNLWRHFQETTISVASVTINWINNTQLMVTGDIEECS